MQMIFAAFLALGCAVARAGEPAKVPDLAAHYAAAYDEAAYRASLSNAFLGDLSFVGAAGRLPALPDETAATFAFQTRDWRGRRKRIEVDLAGREGAALKS